MNNVERVRAARLAIRAVMTDRSVSREETIKNVLELLDETETMLDKLEEYTHEPIKNRTATFGAAVL